MDTGTLLTVIFTGATAVATGGIAFGGIELWKTTERDAAEARAARQVAEHARLRPKFDVNLVPGHLIATMQQARLIVRYLPDGELPVLDRVEIEVLNDTEERSADGPVWGPWQLAPVVEGVDARGRTAQPLRGLKRGREGSWLLYPSTRPDTHSEDNWREAHEGKPLKVRLTVRHDGMEWEYQPDGLVLSVKAPGA